MAVVDINKTNTQDEVIQEVRKIKDELAKRFDYDMKKMLDDARSRQKEGARVVVSPPSEGQ